MGNGDQREVDVLLETHFLRVGLALVGGKCFMLLFLNMGIKVEETPTCFLGVLDSVDFQETRWGPGPEPGRGTFCGQIWQACGQCPHGKCCPADVHGNAINLECTSWDVL